tara:strand:- start:25 stop:651 length:627 start_codon:yes stop_codon:yes gene_type:complete
MRNKLDVICIDGIIGVGKTTQVVIFRNLLKSLNIPHKILTFKEVEGTEYTKNQLESISEYLKENHMGVVICDGSIATDIVEDIANHMHSKDLWSKHKDNLQIYESLNVKFNFINVLLTPTNLELCDRRLQKKANMSGESRVELENKQHLMITAQGLRKFDNNTLTENISFNNIDLNGDENITDIHNQILEIIKQKYQLYTTAKQKKPL